MATLVYLYGPPASGKLTIAEQLVELTGARLFHNHLTVNAITPVFEFSSPAFNEVLRRLRLDVFATAARAGTDVVFTNNSAWSGPTPRTRFVAFAEEARRLVEENGGSALFVQLVAPVTALEHRLANESRRAHGKLLDIGRLREIMATHDPAPLHPEDLIIDSDALAPDEAARRIAAELARRTG